MRDQASTLSPVWKDITARELPIREDDWIRDAVSPEAKQRWDAWLAMPRFRVCHDFPAWAVVVVAFCDEARGGALMQLLRQNLKQQRAAAFAICRTTHRLFRWDRLPIAADVGEVGDVGSVPLASEWDDPDRRMIWDALLADPRHW